MESVWAVSQKPCNANKDYRLGRRELRGRHLEGLSWPLVGSNSGARSCSTPT